MKRIGILTLAHANNYGAVLQAYALETAIRKMGATSEIVSFTKKEKERKPSQSLFYRRVQEQGKKREELFENFRNQYLKRSPSYSETDLSRLNELYDCFIVGSDQVWNLKIPEVDFRYFLPFASPEKRFSYAASFGGTPIITENMISEFQKFSKISVRENLAKEALEKYLPQEISVVLDPVFLLTKEEWMTFVSPSKEKYVLLYLLKKDDELIQAATKFANEKGYILRVVSGVFLPMFGFDPWNGVSVLDFLSFIANAEYVFTNSFHGVAFSLIFENSFSFYPLDQDLKSANIRVEELLNAVEMREAIKGNPMPSQNRVSSYLQKKREISLSYLEQIIKK